MMPGLPTDEIKEETVMKEIEGNSILNKSTARSLQSPRGADYLGNGMIQVETSIEELYENVCDMQSSDQSYSRQSSGSYGEESRIDLELRHLVGGEIRKIEIMQKGEEEVHKPEDDAHSSSSSKKGSVSSGKKLGRLDKSRSTGLRSISSGDKVSRSQVNSEASIKPNVKWKTPPEKPPIDKGKVKTLKKTSTGVLPAKKGKVSKLQNGSEDASKAGLANPDLGPFLLKQLGICLEQVMCLHVTAAINCSLGQYNEAIPLLEQSIEIPVIEEGQEHALAKFAGYMQLGDTYAMLGQLENSLTCYRTGLEVQKQVLGETDPRVGETCRYLAEAHMQALQFDEAQRLCQMALDIHRENSRTASLEEAEDRRLMGLICETKGDHEAALEHLVLARMAMVANGQEEDVASVDCSIGDAYLFCLDMMRLFLPIRKHLQLIPPEEIASGLIDVSAIYESMNDLDQAIKLLQKALKIQRCPWSAKHNSWNRSPDGTLCYNEAVELFEEAKSILEQECGPYHPDTLSVYSNLAGAYDAIGRLDDAIKILEYVIQTREEKLGTANSEVCDEKKRLAELLEEAGRGESRKGRSLETLLDANPHLNSKAERFMV
ncbi:1-deoxy-D-xylulose 5-phosphate reductoisomerase [Hibiscus syriacus]|uniref:1-deoxy-D-xylulose 5-phosphate reductoisomerase n=1 Tax=Hibiscus syriacus TaxID=106335 RepID=A0A6A2WZH8_HIBSY|nr:1-deoxy-D-xylulose 5-phosphate reductoisomerase [Hibiscus syriacus]